MRPISDNNGLRTWTPEPYFHKRKWWDRFLDWWQDRRARRTERD